MSDPDSMTAMLMARLVDRRASHFDRIILRAMIRAAIDVTLSRYDIEDLGAIEVVEQAIREALAMVIAGQ